MTRLIEWLSLRVSDDHKARVVANIETANSREYKRQVASHAITTSIIDDMLEDPYWCEIIGECLASQVS